MRRDIVPASLSAQFSRYGRLVTHCPWPFLIISPILSICLGLGLLQLELTRNIEELYTPVNAPSKHERAVVERVFDMDEENGFSAIRLTRDQGYINVIIKHKDGDNVLTDAIIPKVFELNDVITGVKAKLNGRRIQYGDICCGWHGECVETSFLKIFSNQSLSDVNITFPVHFLPTDRSYLSGEIGGVETDTNHNLISARAVQLSYFVRYNKRSDARRSEIWINAVRDELLKYKSNHITITFRTSLSLEQEFERSIDEIFVMFFVTFATMSLFAMGSVLMLDWVRAKPYVALAGLLASGLAAASSLGLLIFIGVPFASPVGIVPFLVIGIGLDDMYILVSAWRYTSYVHSVEGRMARTLQDAAVSITITSVTDALAFGIGMSSAFASVQIFCAYSMCGVLFCYAYQLTFTAACMSLLGKREQANCHCVTFRKIMPKSEAALKSTLYRLFCTGGSRDNFKPEADDIETSSCISTGSCDSSGRKVHPKVGLEEQPPSYMAHSVNEEGSTMPWEIGARESNQTSSVKANVVLDKLKEDLASDENTTNDKSTDCVITEDHTELESGSNAYSEIVGSGDGLEQSETHSLQEANNMCSFTEAQLNTTSNNNTTNDGNPEDSNGNGDNEENGDNQQTINYVHWRPEENINDPSKTQSVISFKSPGETDCDVIETQQDLSNPNPSGVEPVRMPKPQTNDAISDEVQSDELNNSALVFSHYNALRDSFIGVYRTKMPPISSSNAIAFHNQHTAYHKNEQISDDHDSLGGAANYAYSSKSEKHPTGLPEEWSFSDTQSINKNSNTEEAPLKLPWLNHFLGTHYASFLMRIPVRILVLILYLLYVSIAIWGMFQLEEGLKVDNLVPDDSYVADYYVDFRKYFLPDYGPIIQIVYNEELDYTKQRVRDDIAFVTQSLKRTKYFYDKYDDSNNLNNNLTDLTNFEQIQELLSTTTNLINNVTDRLNINSQDDALALLNSDTLQLICDQVVPEIDFDLSDQSQLAPILGLINTTQAIVNNVIQSFNISRLAVDDTTVISWLQEFERYLILTLRNVNDLDNEEFIRILREEFLTQPGLDFFKDDIVFGDNYTTIKASRFFIQSKSVLTSFEQSQVMLVTRDRLKKSYYNVLPFYLGFIYFDQFPLVVPNTLQGLGIAVACMFIVSLILIPSLVTVILITTTTVSIELGVVGFMAFWGVSMDAVSMINLIMCIGFSVDFAAHISYHYVISKNQDPTENAKEALGYLGAPIVQAALSSILAVAILSTSASYVFRTFFKIVFLIMVFGFCHAMFILPVLLSSIQGLMNFCKDDREDDGDREKLIVGQDVDSETSKRDKKIN